MKAFLDQIKEVMEIEERDISMTDNFKEYDEWDSLASLSLTAMLDEEYGVVFDTKELANLDTLQELYDEVMKRQ
jgi:acyl carrier protein